MKLALLKSKFRALKTEENKVKTLKITTMLLARAAVFEITVGLAQK